MESLLVERSEGVVTVTLNRPERKNAVDGPMWDALAAVLAEVAARDDDRVLVVTGAGGAFCSGADLASPGGPADLSPVERMHHVNAVALALHRLPKPTLAKVGGVAAGAGCNLALGCDLVVASDQARFSEIFTRRGLSLDFGGSWLLPRLVGLHRAKQLALLAEMVDAAEAERMGLVNLVVPAAELDAVVADWAGRLAAGPAEAMARTKALLDESFGRSLEAALDAEAEAQVANFVTTDFAEAMVAFLERREPRFGPR